MRREMILIGGKEYRKFIPHPGPVTDDTCRCITCGQIDEPDYHDDAICQEAHAAIAEHRLPPALVEDAACAIGDTQRAVVLALSPEYWRPAPNHAAAKRLWYREPRLVDHRSQTGNCWSLTKWGVQVRDYLQARAATPETEG